MMCESRAELIADLEMLGAPGSAAVQTASVAGAAIDAIRADAKRIAALEAERATLREALAWVCPASEGFTEAFDGLVERGLLVEVPADADYRAEWDADTMHVWAWAALDGKERAE